MDGQACLAQNLNHNHRPHRTAPQSPDLYISKQTKVKHTHIKNILYL